MIDSSKMDMVTNALLSGMAKSDAYVYAGLTSREIASLEEDNDIQMQFKRYTAQLEYSLLHKMDAVIDKQVRQGRESALVWMLQNINPRYANKTETGGTITLNIDNAHKADIDLE